MPNTALQDLARQQARDDAAAVANHTMTVSEVGDRWQMFDDQCGYEVGTAYLVAYDAAGGIR